jgi:signal transduction histidine kinase
MDDAVVVVDASGTPLLTNRAYDRLVQQSGGALSLCERDHTPVVGAASPLQRAARGDSADLDLVLADRSLGHRTVQVSVRPVRRSGPRGAAGMVHVVDLGMRQGPRLDERFIALFGHDLLAPVSGLQSYAEVLLEYLDDDITSAHAQAAVCRIHKLADRLGLMIRDLVDLARVSSGAVQMARVPTDIRPVVESAVQLAQLLPGAPPIRVTAHGDAMVLGDSRRLGSAILNLLTNAIKHAAASERIDVRVRSDERHVSIDVEDYGCGISPDDQARIFEERYQARPRMLSGGAGPEVGTEGGFGLGLFIAQHLIEAHGGRIRIASQLGSGTCFTVDLPRDGFSTMP